MRLAAYLTALALLPAAAEAAPLGGGSVDLADGCTGVGCFAGEQTFGITASAPVSGTLTLDTGALTLSFQVTASSVSLAETVAGTEDNGVAQLIFSSTTYATTAPLSVFAGGGGTFIVGVGQTASVSGTQTQLDDLAGTVNGTPAAFAAPAATVTGSCIDGGGPFTCGLTFGTIGLSLQVGDPGSGLSPQTRFFRHTLNVATVPEPAAAALLLVGAIAACRKLTSRNAPS